MEETRDADVFVFGSCEDMWKYIEEINPELVDDCKKKLDEWEYETLFYDVEYIVTKFHYSTDDYWSTKHLFVIMPEEFVYNSMSAEYLRHKFDGIKNYTRNQNYKHFPLIKVFGQTFPVKKDVLQDLLEDVFAHSDIAIYQLV